jgi:hypothetical protein
MSPYEIAMRCETPESAEICLTNLIHLAQKEDPSLNYAEAKAIQLANIGYYVGYLGDRERAIKVLELFGTEHPIFGRFEYEVTPEKAFKAGMTLAAMVERAGEVTPEAIEAARKIIEEL